MTLKNMFVSVNKIAAHECDVMLLLILASSVFSMNSKSEEMPHEVLFPTNLK